MADVGGQWAFGMLYLCIVNEDKLRKGENDALSAVKRRFLLCNAMSSFFLGTDFFGRGPQQHVTDYTDLVCVILSEAKDLYA